MSVRYLGARRSRATTPQLAERDARRACPSPVRDAPVGGQAVLEGVMMRGVSTWAVAVRKPDGEIEVSSEPLVSWAKRHRVLRWPVIRGVVALAESLKIGFRALAISANAQLEPRTARSTERRSAASPGA